MSRKVIIQSAKEVLRAAKFLMQPQSIAFIDAVAEKITACFHAGGKVLIAGNGGSLCDAMHFAEELTGQFRFPREPLPAFALCDPGHLTCVSNDMGFEFVFSRSVQALGKTGDLFIALTTSGNSPNVLSALQIAKDKGLGTVAFLGKTGGKVKGIADLEWVVSGFPYSDRIQEAHMAAIHIIIEAVEARLFVHASV